MVIGKRHKIVAALGGGIFLTASAIWLPILSQWLVSLGMSESIASKVAYGLFFTLAALVSYAFVTELIKARLQIRRCDEILQSSKTAKLHDRQLFYAVIEKEISLAGRNGWPVSMIALFVQPMKNHLPVEKDMSVQIRDIVLEELGKVLRDSDIVGSFTKNEYLIFLPNCRVKNAKDVANRLFKYVANKKIIVDDSTTYRLECRCGITGLEEGVANPKRLIAKALEALDRANESDKNIVESD